MIPRAGGVLTGELFRMGDGAAELTADFATVGEFAPVDHLEPSNADRGVRGRGSVRCGRSAPVVTGDAGSCVKLVDHEGEDILGVVDGIAEHGSWG